MSQGRQETHWTHNRAHTNMSVFLSVHPVCVSFWPWPTSACYYQFSREEYPCKDGCFVKSQNTLNRCFTTCNGAMCWIPLRLTAHVLVRSTKTLFKRKKINIHTQNYWCGRKTHTRTQRSPSWMWEKKNPFVTLLGFLYDMRMLTLAVRNRHCFLEALSSSGFAHLGSFNMTPSQK